MHIEFSPSQRTSLGVEWELELIDLDTRQLTGASDALLAEISENGGDLVPVVDLLLSEMRDGLKL